jgi:spore coat protein U-like protein
MRRHALIVAVLIGVAPMQAWALLESCTVTATSLPFGVYDPTNASALDGSGTVTVTCSVTLIGLAASWNISMGTGSSGSYTPRKLMNGVTPLNYNIYTNSNHTQVWGDGSGSTVRVSDSVPLVVGTNVTTYTMFGQIPALQDVRAGAYTDTILVTVNY